VAAFLIARRTAILCWFDRRRPLARRRRRAVLCADSSLQEKLKRQAFNLLILVGADGIEPPTFAV
jgi:hypothetical protein